MPKTAPQTLYDKIFEDHVVSRQPDGTCILYIDRHLVHEVTSPQAFEGLRLAGRKVRAPEKTLAVVDHNIATTADRNQGIKDEESRIQVSAVVTFPSMPDLRDARVSVEVIDNATGKTTVFLGGPDT